MKIVKLESIIVNSQFIIIKSLKYSGVYRFIKFPTLLSDKLIIIKELEIK